MKDGIEAYFSAHFRLASAAQDEALRYYAAQPGSGLARLAELTGSDAPPYWAHLWPGGAALIEYLAGNPLLVAGKSVLDFGCGCGLAGIAARRHGARMVICYDIEEIALAAARLNAQLNDVSIATSSDPDDPAFRSVDLVLAGDVFYDAAVATSSLPFLRACAARGAAVLVGDIGRAYLPTEGLCEIARYAVHDVGDSASAQRTAGVFHFRPAEQA